MAVSEGSRRSAVQQLLERGAGVTVITDADYRCVWRPCRALEEDGGESNQDKENESEYRNEHKEATPS